MKRNPETLPITITDKEAFEIGLEGSRLSEVVLGRQNFSASKEPFKSLLVNPKTLGLDDTSHLHPGNKKGEGKKL